MEEVPNSGEERTESSKRASQRSQTLRARSKRNSSAANGEKVEANGNIQQEPYTYNDVAYVMDSGAYTIKAGMSTFKEPLYIPNCIMKVKSEKKRSYIGNQIEECRDCSGLYYILPCSKGYIMKWEVQKAVWDYMFSKPVCPMLENTIIMTQPLFNFKSIEDCVDEIFFEEYGVRALFKANPTDLAKYRYIESVCNGVDDGSVVVDSGFSYTHVVPYIQGEKYVNSIKRLNIGGKFLTNVLKDTVSYRMYDVRDETYVMNQVKEDTFFVSTDFDRDLRISRKTDNSNSIVRNYVLPDFNNIKRGYVQDVNCTESPENCQILSMNNERFTISELLFSPSDIHMRGMGIAEAVATAIMECPQKYRQQLANNIVLTGGNVNMPGFAERVENDVKKLLPERYSVKVYKPDNPTTFAWCGGRTLARAPDFSSLAITKQEYEELGSDGIKSRFNVYTFPEEQTPRRPRRQVVSYIDHVRMHHVFGHEPPGTNYNGMMLVPDQQQNNGPMRVIDTLSPEGRRGLKRALEEDKENLSHFSMFDHYMMYGVQPYESMYV